MPKIAFRIMAVEERRSLVDDLVVQSGINDVMWDYEHKGAIWNHIRTFGSFSSDDTHICVLNDDVEVCENFKDIVSIASSMFPDVIFSFYNKHLNYSDRKAHTPYVKMQNCNLMGACVCFPTNYYDEYLHFINNDFKGQLDNRGKPFDRDDTMMRTYALLTGKTTMCTIPNLVCAKPVKSTFSRFHPTKNSDAWQGRSVDINQFYSSDYGVAILPFEPHMKKDDPMLIRINNELKVRALKERI